MLRMTSAVIALLLAGTTLAEANGGSLRGSPASMQEQNRIAREHSLAFYRTPAEIQGAVERGDLVRFEGNANYAVADFVRHPFAQPELLVFVERLAAQYREACGQKLVVTSLVRASTEQPANAHRLSVHPAGMAVDLRVSDRPACVQWLSDALLGLDQRGVLNATREYRPPHFHVAVYPKQYMEYAAERMAEEALLPVAVAADEPTPPASQAAPEAAAPALEIGSMATTPRSSRLGLLALLGLLPLPAAYLAARQRKAAAAAMQPITAPDA
jgi:hypothetical protein